MKTIILLFAIAALTFLFSEHNLCAQQYKLRQATNMMGMKVESTIYVKGMRKRTEPGSMMGMPASPITIEQCDLQRTIKINDKKKLYFIEPFAKDDEEIIEEDEKTAPKPKTQPMATSPKNGGIIYSYSSTTDTGERKKMFGFTARHIWTSKKMVPSPNACTMKDSLLVKTDGWYIDLPLFNCPVPRQRLSPMQEPEKPKQQTECKDKFVTRTRGKAKLGFPLEETTTIIMGDEKKSTNHFETSVETMELNTLKLDSMLFEIPIGYKETKNEQDLIDKMDIKDLMNQYQNSNVEKNLPSANEPKEEGKIRIGVLVPAGDEQVNVTGLQQHLTGVLNGGHVEAVAVFSEEEAKSTKCDYSLSTTILKIKSGSKVGGLLKAVKNADPNAASSYTIEANMLLKSLADGSAKAQPKIEGKFEGKIDDATKKAMDEGGRQVLLAVSN